MAHNEIQIIFTYNAIKYLSHLKLHKVSHRDLYTNSFSNRTVLVVKNDQDDRKWDRIFPGTIGFRIRFEFE